MKVLKLDGKLLQDEGYALVQEQKKKEGSQAMVASSSAIPARLPRAGAESLPDDELQGDSSDDVQNEEESGLLNLSLGPKLQLRGFTNFQLGA